MNKFAAVMALLVASALASPVHASARSIRTADPPVGGFTDGTPLSAPIAIASPLAGGDFSISVPSSPSGSGIDTEWYQNFDESQDAIDWCKGSCDLASVGSTSDPEEEAVMGDVVAQLFIQPDPNSSSVVDAYMYFQCGYQFSLATVNGSTTSDVTVPNTCGTSTVGEADYLVDINLDGSIASAAAVPEPAVGGLFAAALGLLLATRRFRRNQAE